MDRPTTHADDALSGFCQLHVTTVGAMAVLSAPDRRSTPGYVVLVVLVLPPSLLALGLAPMPAWRSVPGRAGTALLLPVAIVWVAV